MYLIRLLRIGLDIGMKLLLKLKVMYKKKTGLEIVVNCNNNKILNKVHDQFLEEI